MDSNDRIVRALQNASDDCGRPPPDAARCRAIIGLGLREALCELHPDANPTVIEALASRYREHFLFRDTTPMPLFPSAEADLRALHASGRVLAIATGKSRRGLDRVLGETAIASLFSATRCADECPSKPAPQMIEEILAETGMQAHEAVMIGDSVYDVRMAHAAGVAALAVTYGANDRETLAREHPLACLDSLTEVCAWLH